MACIFLFISPSWALELPKGLRSSELSEVIETVGVNTSTKFLSNPYALGGHSGFEIGISSEYIDVTDLNRLGTNGQSDPEEESFSYTRVTIGKGMYYNIDLFVQFIPFSSSNDLSEYGGTLKWMFWENKEFPLNLSALFHTSTITIEDAFTNRSRGWDLMAGINLRQFALYLGGGNVDTKSTFNQNILDCNPYPSRVCSTGINLDTDHSYRVFASHPHSFVGVQTGWSRLFLAVQLDKYEQPVYSAKLGLRF